MGQERLLHQGREVARSLIAGCSCSHCHKILAAILQPFRARFSKFELQRSAAARQAASFRIATRVCSGVSCHIVPWRYPEQPRSCPRRSSLIGAPQLASRTSSRANRYLSPHVYLTSWSFVFTLTALHYLSPAACSLQRAQTLLLQRLRGQRKKRVSYESST